MIKFNKYNVVSDKFKARVHYSLDNRVDGRKCVTIYAKDYNEGLRNVFENEAEYVNNSDYCTDYVETGRVVLFEDHPLYAAARAKVEAINAK